jgi:hypothetical protein
MINENDITAVFKTDQIGFPNESFGSTHQKLLNKFWQLVRSYFLIKRNFLLFTKEINQN